MKKSIIACKTDGLSSRSMAEKTKARQGFYLELASGCNASGFWVRINRKECFELVFGFPG